MTNRSNFIYYIKTVAVLLIINSHLDNLYPSSALSIGGSLGNTLFFLVSGYLLSNRVNSGFGKWMLNRMFRIYPALWIISGLLFAIGYLKIASPIDFAFRMLFPYYTYWFVAAILIIYALVWFVNKSGKIEWWIIGAGIIYIVWYVGFMDITKWSIEGPCFFKYVFYFIVTLMGILLRKNSTINDKLTKKGWILFTVCSTVLYLITRGAVAFVGWFAPYQFLVHIATFLFGVSFFETLYSFEKDLSCKRHLLKVVKVIGDSTLEIYLLNYGIIAFSKMFKFPINVLFVFIMAILLGIICNKMIAVFVKKINTISVYTGV